MPIETIAPPAPKAPAVDTTAATTKPAETADTKAVDTTASTTTAKSAETADATKKGAKHVDPIAARIKAAMDAEKASKEQKEVVPAKDEKPLPSGDKELDAEIETVTKDLTPAQKKAFTHKTYELRDMKRKLADAEVKGKNTDVLQAKVTELEGKLAAAPKDTGVDPKEVESYKEQIKTAQEKADALSKELEIAAVERTEEFKRAVTLPKKAIEDRIKALAEKYEIAPKVLLNAVYGSSDDQVEAVEKLSEPEKVKFYNDALRIAELDERAETLRTNAAEANVKIAAKREAETKSQREQNDRVFAEAHKANWKALQEAVPILAPAEGDDEVTKTWNTHLANAEKWSRETDFTALDAEEQSRVLQHASIVPMLLGANKSKDAANAQLTAELATANEALGKFRANKAGGEATPAEGLVDTKPKELGAKGTAARIQAALHGRGQ